MFGNNIQASVRPVNMQIGHTVRYRTLLNLTQWWFENRMPYPPERMEEIFQTLVMLGVWAAIGRSLA